MKSIYLIIAITLLSVSTKAQMVVSDPAALKVATTGWAQSLSEAVAQSKTLMETKDLLSQSVDLYSTVSNTIQNIHTVKSIIDRQVNMVVFINKELGRKDIANMEHYTKYINSLDGILMQSQSLISMVNVLLNPTTSMTQGERLSIIMELDKQSQEAESRMRLHRRSFDNFNKTYKMLAPLKNIK